MKLWVTTVGAAVSLIALSAGYFAATEPPGGSGTQQIASLDTTKGEEHRISVVATHPCYGAMEYKTVQAGSVQAYESVQLFAKASGYLKSQTVDIGDSVKKGQVLAIVDAPELEKQVQKNAALVEQARASVKQHRARITTAKAEFTASEASVAQAEASAKSASAWVRFRGKQLQRMTELFALKSIDERLVDENRERFDAAVETENSSKAAIVTARAQVAAADAKIRQAEADLLEAEEHVKVAQAELEKSQVLLSFATVTAPFDGLITQRSFFPGDFVRSASEGAAGQPLLTIQKVDRMRVVVQVPDGDVPFIDPGDKAIVELDAMPGEKFHAKVSRIAGAEDPQTRQMRIEIDLPNSSGKIRQGMYGRVSIMPETATKLLSIPSACLVGETRFGRGYVSVVRDGKVRRVPVRLGVDDGVRVVVQQGLSEADVVVLRSNGNLDEDDAHVHVTFQPEASKVLVAAD